MSNIRSSSTVILFQSLGTPSGLAYGCFALLQTMVNAVYGDHVLIQSVYLSEIKAKWDSLDQKGLKPIIIVSDCPSSEMTSLIASTRLPVLIILDDFAECVGHALSARNMPLPEALRFVTQCFCAIGACQASDKLVICRNDIDRPLKNILQRFAHHFGINPSHDAVSQTLVALHHNGAQTLRSYIESLGIISEVTKFNSEDPTLEAMLRLLAAPYQKIGRGETVDRLEWPVEMFLDWDRPGQFLRGPVDLTGPARFIVCGPYFHLPAGRWIVEVIIEIIDNLSGAQLMTDVFSGAILGGIKAPLPSAGRFSFSIPFITKEPFLPVELRFQILQGAIEGSIVLRSVQFKIALERKTDVA